MERLMTRRGRPRGRLRRRGWKAPGGHAGSMGVVLCCLGVALIVAVYTAPPVGASPVPKRKATPAPQELTVGVFSENPSEMAWFAAQSEGFFHSEGLSVQFLNFGNPEAGVSALASRSVNLALGGASDVILGDAGGGLDTKMVYQVLGGVYDIWGSKDYKGKNITSLKQLAGTSVATSAVNGNDTQYFEAVMHHDHISTAHITIEALGNGLDRIGALRNGTSAGLAYPAANRASVAPYGNLLLKAEDSPIQYPTLLLTVNEPYLSTHTSTIRKMVAAVQAATDWVVKPKNRATAISLCEKNTLESQILCSEQYSYSLKYEWPDRGKFTAQQIRTEEEAIGAGRPTVTNLPVSKVADFDFVK